MHTVWLPTGDELNPGHGRHISVLLREDLKCLGGQAIDKVKRNEVSEMTKKKHLNILRSPTQLHVYREWVINYIP